jgi:hypothetical protein
MILREESFMSNDVQVGTILMSGWPQVLGVESLPYSENWSLVKPLEAFALERRIREAGWHFFFVASEVKVMFLGAIGVKKVQEALHRILGKVSEEHFNGLEVTGIVAKSFLGLPYTIVSAHSRHVQQDCYLDGVEARRSAQRDEAWAKG